MDCWHMVFGGIRPDSMPKFQRDFETWIASQRDHLNLAFAFPSGPDGVLRLLFWIKGKEITILEELNSDAFAESDKDDDDKLYVFGGETVPAEDRSGVFRRIYHPASLAGYMRPFPNNRAKSAPMIGIFRRAIQQGKLQALATAFHPVCNIWYDTVPGILAAMVASDPMDENYVLDVRIFADKASYDGPRPMRNSFGRWRLGSRITIRPYRTRAPCSRRTPRIRPCARAPSKIDP